ncbi:MAG: hypothetical protein MUE69_32535 [Myxococcota bacterium]|jgi:hypothetical protein|nr:hypothetical protein [Myxococcota bacterium]
MSAARIEKLETLLARVQRNRHAAPTEPRRKPSTPLELAVESAELPLPSEPPPAPPALLEAGTPPAGVKVTPSFAKVAIPVDDEPELVVSEPSGDYDVVIDGDDGDDDDGDELPTVPPPPPEPPAVVIASPGFEPVQLPPLPPSERPPAIEALPVAALVEPTPPAAIAKTPVAEPAVAKAPPIAEAPVEAPRVTPSARPIEAPLPPASAPVARVVAPAPRTEPSTFGELLDRTLALRPR